MAVTAFASVDTVANLKDPTTPPIERQKAIQQFDANASLCRQLTAAIVPQISQKVRIMTTDWPNETIEQQLTGKEVSKEIYELISQFGGFLPPRETEYGCIFFTFTLREEPHLAQVRGRKISIIRLFIDNVRLTKVLERR